MIYEVDLSKELLHDHVSKMSDNNVIIIALQVYISKQSGNNFTHSIMH